MAVLLIQNSFECVCVCASYCTFLMSSSVWISGERPPCTQRNCWFIRAARGKQSNASMQESYTCSEYLILPGGGWTNGEIFQDLRQRRTWVGEKPPSPQMYNQPLSLGGLKQRTNMELLYRWILRTQTSKGFKQTCMVPLKT